MLEKERWDDTLLFLAQDWSFQERLRTNRAVQTLLLTTKPNSRRPPASPSVTDSATSPFSLVIRGVQDEVEPGFRTMLAEERLGDDRAAAEEHLSSTA